MPYVAAALSGILAVLAYPFHVVDGGPAAWWAAPPLILVAFVPLLRATLDAPTGRRRFMLGWLTGAIHLWGMQGWIGGTLVRMSHFPEWAGLLCGLTYAAWAGLPFALLSWALGHRARVGTAFVVVLPILAAFVERYAPVLFPFHAAGAFFTMPWVLQGASVLGVLGLSAAVWAINLGLALAWRAGPERRLGLLVAAAGAAVILGVRPGAPEPGAPLDVLLVQPNVTTEQKSALDPRVREGVYRATVAQTRAAVDPTACGAHCGPDAPPRPALVVWPEGGFPFTYQAAQDTPAPRPTRPEKYSALLRRFAADLNLPLVTGSIAATQDASGPRDTNSALFFRPGLSNEPLRYDKRLLLLFGEHIPFADWFPSLRTAVPGMSHHLEGAGPATWDVGGLRLGVTICYEAIFAGFVREVIDAEDAHVLLNLTNDVWFGHTVAAAQHLMVQTPRAIETRRWVIRSTNSGISAFVSPTGELVGMTAMSQAATTRATVTASVPGARTVYQLVGDWPLAALGIVAAAAGHRRRRA